MSSMQLYRCKSVNFRNIKSNDEQNFFIYFIPAEKHCLQLTANLPPVILIATGMFYHHCAIIIVHVRYLL